MMAGQVFTAAQLSVAIQELLRRQSNPEWPDLVVVYHPDRPTSPLSVNTTKYARFTELAVAVCTSGDLLNYRGQGTLERLLALLTRRVEPGSSVTLQQLRAATDVDNITDVLTTGYAQFDDAAALMRGAYKSLQLCRGYEMQWACGRGRGIDSKKVVLEFLGLKTQPTVHIGVYSRRPSLGFERRTIPSLAEAHPQVRVRVGIAATRVLSGALAAAFAQLCWSAYKDYLLAEKLQQDMA